MKKHWYHWQDSALHLYVHIHPGAKTSEIKGILENRLRIRLKSPPAEGKANKELVALLARDFGTRKAQVRISGGETGRDKHIEIHSPAITPPWFTALLNDNKTV